MKEEIRNYSKPTRLFFFLIGVLATVAYRIIIVLDFYNAYLVKTAWYVGTVGFVLYFGYTFNVQRRESKIVSDYNLVESIKKSRMKIKEKRILYHVVKLVSTSKEKWNSLFICLLSFGALVIGILLDMGWVG